MAVLSCILTWTIINGWLTSFRSLFQDAVRKEQLLLLVPGDELVGRVHLRVEALAAVHSRRPRHLFVGFDDPTGLAEPYFLFLEGLSLLLSALVRLLLQPQHAVSYSLS